MNNHLPTVLLMTNALRDRGGAEQQLYVLAKGIDKSRFRVLVATLYDEDFLAWQIPQVEFIKLKRTGKYDFSPAFRVMKILLQCHVDIIQPFLTPSILFGLLPAFVARTRVKVVTERCGLRNAQPTGYKILRLLEDLLGRSAQAAVANSVAGQQMLLERGYQPEKTHVIYNGIDLDRLKADPLEVEKIKAETGLDPDEPVIGISAWITPAKDHFTFLKSASIVLQHKPKVRFAILGDGPLLPALKNMTEELNIAKQVTFFGSQKQVGNYLNFFDILVSSSLDHEGCSNSIIEAMALSKAVVATDIGGNREVIIHGKNGLLIPPKDPEALAGAILSLLDDPDKARFMGANGGAMAFSLFDQKNMAAQYENLWLELLKRNSRRN